jgi:hypothetical protein
LNLTENLVIDGFEHDFTGVIEANGFQIQVVNGGTLNWDGFEVRNAARIMFMDCAGPSTLRNGLVVDSGRDEPHFYPLHWHLNYDCTRGTLVENVTVRNSPNRAFVPHGSHGISFLNVHAENIRLEAFWWNPPGTTNCDTHRKFCADDNSNDIHIDGLVATGVYMERDCGGTVCPGWHSFSAVVLGAGSGNSIRNSVVSNVSGGSNCAGYHWPGTANQNIGGNVWVFEDNRVENIGSCHGIRVWQNDSREIHPIVGFTGGGIDHGAYKNTYLYRNVTVPYLNVHAVSWSMEDSRVGNAVMRRHTLAGDPITFTRVTFGSFTVADGYNGIHPATYILNGTNLSCSDIVWDNPHPDSRVFVDGGEC